MANYIEIPEETLMRIGFRLLDIMYGELVIVKGTYWDEVFVDKYGDGRLAYESGEKTRGLFGYLYKDRGYFLSVIPTEWNDFERVLKVWFEDRYKRRVDKALMHIDINY